MKSEKSLLSECLISDIGFSSQIEKKLTIQKNSSIDASKARSVFSLITSCCGWGFLSCVYWFLLKFFRKALEMITQGLYLTYGNVTECEWFCLCVNPTCRRLGDGRRWRRVDSWWMWCSRTGSLCLTVSWSSVWTRLWRKSWRRSWCLECRDRNGASACSCRSLSRTRWSHTLWPLTHPLQQPRSSIRQRENLLQRATSTSLRYRRAPQSRLVSDSWGNAQLWGRTRAAVFTLIVLRKWLCLAPPPIPFFFL